MERTASLLFTTHLRSSLGELITGVVHRVSAFLLSRRGKIATELGHGAEEGAAHRSDLAQAVAREVTAVLADLWECSQRLEGSPPVPREINQVVRQAIETARAAWEKRPRWQKGSLELTFEPSAEPLMAEISTTLVGALAHAIENAVEGMPKGGRIHIRTARENGHALISLGERGARMIGEGALPSSGSRHLRLDLAIVRAFATRHGGEATVSRGSAGEITLVLRLPTTQVRMVTADV